MKLTLKYLIDRIELTKQICIYVYSTDTCYIEGCHHMTNLSIDIGTNKEDYFLTICKPHIKQLLKYLL